MIIINNRLGLGQFVCFLVLILLHFSSVGQAQDCGKNWMHYEVRRVLSEETAAKHNLTVPIEKIQVDYLGVPVGVPFQYARHFQAHAHPDTLFKAPTKSGKATFRLLKEAHKQWELLRQAALNDSLVLRLSNTYRSYQKQQELYRRFGGKLAERAGYSEHHLATTIDLYNIKADSYAFLWLLRYAFDYGWVPTYYFRVEEHIRQEPWHWRYVGKLAAQKFRCAWEDEINRKIWRLKESFNRS